jgi:two-component system CheB/CheR fusion protein
MNEELQSTNEELETINDELRQRTLQLNDVNAFLETILSSLRLSVAVLDRSLKVQIWNAQSEEIWGLRSAEAEGEFFLGLDIGLPVDRLKHTLRAALDGRGEREELTLQATNRRGRPITCSVTILPMGGLEEPSGVILLMQELSGEAAETAAAGDMA